MDAAKWKYRGTERESFILKQIHFRVNDDMQQHGNTLTYDLVQCDIFKNLIIAQNGQVLVWPKHVAIDVILMLS
jgi:hypothetical protein